MRHLDLFSGIGGFALAAKWCWGDEYENVGHSEIEEFPCKVYHEHIKDSKCLGNIQKISYSQRDSLAKMLPLRGSEKDLAESKQDCLESWQELLMKLNQSGLSSKMFPDFFLSTEGEIWRSSLPSFPKSGIAWRGECLMLNTSEWLKEGDVCGLSEVLEIHVPQKYYLSKRAVEGMIKRSLKWGRGGYVFLQEMVNETTQRLKHLSLQQLALIVGLKKERLMIECENTTSSLPQFQQMTTTGEMQEQKEIMLPKQSEQPKGEILPLYGKTLILRKLTPMEKERLMGYEDNYTASLDSDAKRGHGLGNAIVPQVAYEIFKRIKEIDNELISKNSSTKSV
jgi:site-specific DNA-cytosine methylase